MEKNIKVAAIQQSPIFLNLSASIERAEELCIEAANNGAQLIVFPETWLPGYPFWIDSAPNAAIWDYPPAKKTFALLFENSIRIGSAEFKRLQKLAFDCEAYLFFGINEKFGGTIYNSQLFLHKNGKDYLVHRKLVPTYTERLIWGRGDGSTLGSLNTEFGNIGGLICWEHWMPFARAFMHSQNEVIHIAQWPSVRDLHLLASRHYAFEGQCFVVASGTVVKKADLVEGVKTNSNADSSIVEFLNSIPINNEDFLVNGGSAVIKPNTEFASEPQYDNPDTLYSEIDLTLIAEGNQYLDSDGHYSRPDIFTLNVDTSVHKNVNTK